MFDLNQINMKKIKSLMLFFSISTLVLVSCSSGDESVDAQKSSALRIFLNEFKIANNISGRSMSTDSDMCYDFVYPITLSFNNETTIIVTSESELVELLESETNQLHFNGLVFPFSLIAPGSTTPITISNESEFWSVINQCDMNTYEDYISSGSCYAFVYPFSLLMSNNQTLIITNEQDLLNIAQQSSQGNYIVDLAYPFSVIIDNNVTQVNNDYEYSNLYNDCNSTNCNCPSNGTPVCVSVGGVIIPFPNACVAECAGYTSSDFVTCN